MMRRHRHIGSESPRKWLITKAILTLVCLCGVLPVLGQEPRVKVGLSGKTIFLGEVLTFQLQIEGDDNPPEPDLSHIKDFTIEFLGTKQNNESSMTIIGGRMQRFESKGCFLTYKFTPKRAGLLTIPVVHLKVARKKLRTQPITIKVSLPTERDDMKLVQTIPTTPLYPGQPFTLTVRWLISPTIVKRVDNWNANVPVLSTADFKTIESELKQKPDQREVVVGGKRYLGVTWTYTLFANRPGDIVIPPASLSCQLVKGNRQPNDPFADSFFFGSRRRTSFDKAVIPSNTLTLKVTPLPTRGQPVTFNGLIGSYVLETQASPLDVNVGDPITLRLMVSGPAYLGNVAAPALDKQPVLSRNFKLSSDELKGKQIGRRLVFETTLRASHSDVSEIPAIELPFFDVKTGTYSIARSKPIPIKVKATKVVTALDAEGSRSSGAAEISAKLESNTRGIAHNYGVDACLVAQMPGGGTLLASRAGMALISLPPAVWFILFVATSVIRKRHANPEAIKARQAFAKLQANLKTVKGDSDLLDVLKHYLGSKLYLQAGALTYKDVEAELKKRSVDAEIIEKLKTYFDRGEAARFAGGSSSADMENDLAVVGTLVKSLEKAI